MIRPGAVVEHEGEGAVVIRHDARALPLEDESVDLIVTSPPYFALRSYRDDGEHYDGQLGSEDTPAEFIDNLVACVAEWVRVLKPSGSMFVNLGDKYAGSGGAGNGQSVHSGRGSDSARRAGSDARYNQDSGGVRAKSRLLLPHRFAIACIDQLGLIVRMDMVWSKPNGLPESVTDRVRASHEYWFHIVKEPRYFTGLDEIREPHKEVSLRRAEPHRTQPGASYRNGKVDDYNPHTFELDQMNNPLGRLPGSVWRIPTEPLLVPDQVRAERGLPDHFAAFPQEWPRRLIAGFSPDGGTVLDPFGGTGTVAGVARTLGRFGISNDLSADYNRLATWRIWESGHFEKTRQRMWADRQTQLL